MAGIYIMVWIAMCGGGTCMATGSAEFNTKAACENARAELQAYRSMCVAKGTR